MFLTRNLQLFSTRRQGTVSLSMALVRVRGAVQNYAWGKVGGDAMVAQLAAAATGPPTFQPFFSSNFPFACPHLWRRDRSPSGHVPVTDSFYASLVRR